MFYISENGCTHFKKVYKIPKNVDMKQVPYSGTKSIRRHRKKVCGSGDLASLVGWCVFGVCVVCVCVCVVCVCGVCVVWCVCMYVCMLCICVCMCVCMYVCIYVCVCMYVCYVCMYVMYLCMYVFIYVCMYICVCMYVCIMYVCFMYVCILVCMCVLCMYACMYVCVYMHAHTHKLYICSQTAVIAKYDIFKTKHKKHITKEFRCSLSGTAVVTKFVVNHKARHICIVLAIPLLSPRTVRETTTQNCVSSDSRPE